MSPSVAGMDAGCVIRDAAPGDGARLEQIDGLVSGPSGGRAGRFDLALGTAGRSGRTPGGERALVLEEGGQVVAYLLYTLVIDEATINTIGVDPPAQGRGLGGQLLAAALDRIRRDGARRCLLEVRRGNRAARALYEGRGFAVDGVRKNYYPAAGGREDAVLMSRPL